MFQALQHPGQLHALAALPLGKESQVPTGRVEPRAGVGALVRR